ncbi:MAG: putative porin [Desulfuromonadales bacterium]|nr:putative porin [Desulfuromonadales bacterium]
MRFKSKFACTALASLLLVSSGSALAASSTDGGVDALLELLSAKGVITPEEGAGLREKSAGSASTGIKAMLELLESKGAISKEEAEAVLKRSVAKTKRKEPVPEQLEAGAEPKEGEAVSEANIKLPEKEVRPVVEVLREQGVLGSDEAEQIRERIGKAWTPSEDEDFIALENQEIEYNRTSLPKEGLLSNIAKLRHQALITDEEAERIRKRFLHKLSLEQVTDSIAASMQDKMQMEVAGRIIPIPEWTQRIKIGGDLRLRYRADLFDRNNGPFFKPDQFALFPLGNSTVDRSYAQIRARLNLSYKITDTLEGALGMATGNTTNPVSTNATLGDSLNKKNFLLDLAYLKWTPLPELTIWGGRFANPWFCTDLVWDQDVNFDGLALSWKPSITPSLNAFFTVGAFPIQEYDLSGRDKWLYAGQLGANYTWQDKLTTTLAAAYYHFYNVTGVKNSSTTVSGLTDSTRPAFQQRGNTTFFVDNDVFVNSSSSGFDGWKGLAADYNELNISAKVDYAFMDPYHLTLIADYVNNIGYNSADVNARVGQAIKKETEGFQVGLTVGHPDTREAWKWKLMLNYKYLEADAVLDAFTDSDFHLGGTNAKGWIFGADLGVAKNVWFSTRWYTANEITGYPMSIDVFQFNLNARF